MWKYITWQPEDEQEREKCDVSPRCIVGVCTQSQPNLRFSTPDFALYMSFTEFKFKGICFSPHKHDYIGLRRYAKKKGPNLLHL